MLYMSYKPGAYWFESVQMGFKLALWASLAFFKDDPQLKMAAAVLVCFVQVTLHAHLKPFNTVFKNVAQGLGIATAFTVSFGGMVIKYLTEAKKNANLLSNEELFASLEFKLIISKVVLEVAVYLSFVGYGILGVYMVAAKLKKYEDSIRGKCAKYCKCLGIRSRSASNSTVAAAAAVNPDFDGRQDGDRNQDSDGEGESKQKGAIEMTGIVAGAGQRQGSTDLDANRAWSFSHSAEATAKDDDDNPQERNFQTTNPLHVNGLWGGLDGERDDDGDKI